MLNKKDEQQVLKIIKQLYEKDMQGFFSSSEYEELDSNLYKYERLLDEILDEKSKKILSQFTDAMILMDERLIFEAYKNGLVKGWNIV